MGCLPSPPPITWRSLRGSSRRGWCWCALYVQAPADTCPSLCCSVGILRTRKYAISRDRHYRSSCRRRLWARASSRRSTFRACGTLPQLCRAWPCCRARLSARSLGLVSGQSVRPFRRAPRGDSWRYRGGAGGRRAVWSRLGIDSDSFINLTITYTVLVGGPAVHYDAAEHLGRELARQQACIQHAQGVSNTLNQVAASLGTAVLVSSLGASAPLRGSRRRPRSSRPTSAITWRIA